MSFSFPQRLSSEHYMKTTLHFCREHIPDYLDQKRVVYFIRNLVPKPVTHPVTTAATNATLHQTLTAGGGDGGPVLNANRRATGDAYFVVVVPSFTTIEEAEEKLPEWIGFGVYSAPALKALNVFTNKARPRRTC